jgi:hypothetical protein
MRDPEVYRSHSTSIEYWERKHEELALLAAFAGQESERVSTVPQLVAEKQRLRAQLLARAVAAHPELTESNLGGQSDPQLRYQYQRFDLGFKTKPFLQKLYPIEADAAISFGVLTGSGMGAISATLAALDQVLPSGTRLLLGVDSYFETVRFAHLFLRRIKVETDQDAPLNGSILYLDSIAVEDALGRLERRELSSLAVVLFDTTCYDAGSLRIAAVVRKCIAERVPCILLRSHLKLDCLGTEYWRLGSVVIAMAANARTDRVRLAKAVRTNLIEFVSLTGGGFSPHALFPLADNPTGRALNRQRNEWIQRNNRLAGEALANACAPTRVVVPHHGCFVVLRPVTDTIWDVERAMRRLVDKLERTRLHVRIAPSFGYDFISLTRLTAAETRQSSIRLALPDYCDQDILRCVEVVGPFAASLLPTAE